MFTSRRTGHLVGKILLFLASGFLSYGVTLSENVTRAILIAVACAGSGVYLLKKLYMSDPEAVNEYREKVFQQRMKQNVKDFGPIPNLLKLVSRDELRKLIEADLGADRISPWISHMGASTVRELLDSDVFTRDEVARAYSEELKFHKTFTSLWGAGLCGEMPALFKLGVVDVDASRELLLAEYDWVDEDGSPRANAPPSADDGIVAPGGAIGVFPALLQYAKFATDALRIKKGFFISVAQTCPFAVEHPFSDLVRDGLVELAVRGYLTQPFVENKFLQQLRSEAITNLWVAEDKLRVSLLLENHLIAPQLVAPLFASAIPTIPSLGAATERNNIVKFMVFWRSALEHHAAVLVPHYLHAPMQNAFRTWAQESSEIERQLTNATFPNDLPPQARRQREAQLRRDRDTAIQALEISVHEAFVGAAAFATAQFNASASNPFGSGVSVAANATCSPM